MRQLKHEFQHIGDDLLVTRAHRKETIRGAVKLFRVLMDAVCRHAEWAESRHGLDAAQIWALWELGQAPGLRAVDLAKAMAVHRVKAEELLQSLVALGLAGRHAQADDAALGHTLTPAGERLCQSIPQHGQGVLVSALEQLPDPALHQIVEALRPLLEVLPFRQDRAALNPMADSLKRISCRGERARRSSVRPRHAD